MSEPTKCGQKFRALLEEANISQTALATDLGVRPKDVHQWTIHGVPAVRCFVVGRHLQVNPEWLISDDPGVERTAIADPDLAAQWSRMLAEATPAQLRGIRALLRQS